MLTTLLLFGTVRLKTNNYFEPINGIKLVALIAILALEQGNQHRDKLATLLWENGSQQESRTRLRQVLQRLKDIFDEDHLRIERDVIGFKFGTHFTSDVHKFLEIAEQVNTTSIEKLISAVEIYQDDFLAGFTLPDSSLFDAWQRQKRNMLERKLANIYTKIITVYLEKNKIDQSLYYANELVDRFPWQEAHHKLMMEMYIANDDIPAAINQYHLCRQILRDNLSIETSKSINALYQQLLTNSHVPISHKKLNKSIRRFPPRPSLVIGRNDDLQAIQHHIQSDELSQLVIQGWPGIGKSTLIAELAHHPKTNNLAFDGILWTALGEKPDLKHELDQLIHAIRPNSPNVSQSLAESSETLRHLLYQNRILLLVDDVWDAIHLQWFQILNVESTLIVSTRFNDVARQIATSPDEIYKLDILSEEQAYTLLEHLAPDIVADYQPQAKQLIIDLDGLPLALQVAGRLLQAEIELGWGIDDLLIALREGRKLLEAKAPLDRLDIEKSTLPSVATLLKQSTDRLTEDMRLKFATLGLLAPKPATFDVETIAAMWELEQPREGIRILVDRGLLEPVGNGRFQMHALLVMYAQSMFDKP